MSAASGVGAVTSERYIASAERLHVEHGAALRTRGGGLLAAGEFRDADVVRDAAPGNFFYSCGAREPNHQNGY